MKIKVLELLFSKNNIDTSEYSAGLMFRDYHRIKFKFLDELPKLKSGLIEPYEYSNVLSKEKIIAIEFKYNLMVRILNIEGVFKLVYGVCIENELFHLFEKKNPINKNFFLKSKSLIDLKYGLNKIGSCF